GSFLILPYGHAGIQSPHFVHRSTNNSSSTAPGGRSQSVLCLTSASCCAGAAVSFSCSQYSWTALPIDQTARLKNWRRPLSMSSAITLVSLPSHPQLEVCILR